MKYLVISTTILSLLTGCNVDSIKDKLNLNNSDSAITDVEQSTETTTIDTAVVHHTYTSEEQEILDNIYVSNIPCKYTVFEGGYYLMTNKENSEDIYAVRPVLTGAKDISSFPDAELNISKGYIIAEPIPNVTSKSYISCGEKVYSISEKTLLYFSEDSTVKMNGILLKRDPLSGKVKFKTANMLNMTYVSDFDTTDVPMSKITYKDFTYRSPAKWVPSKLEYIEPSEVSLELDGRIKQVYKTSELTKDKYYYLYNSMADKDNPSEYQFYKNGRIVANNKLQTNARLLISPEDYDEIIIYDCIISGI